MEKKKKILFVIGISEIAEHRDVIIDAIRHRLDILGENKDKIDVDIALYPSDRGEWNRLDQKLSEKLFEMLEDAAGSCVHIVEIDPKDGEKAAKEYDAYYGSPSFMPLHFTGDKKPVMIADMSLDT